MSYLKDNKDNVIVIKEEYKSQKNKKIKKIAIVIGVVIIFVGGVTAKIFYDGWRENKVTKQVNEYKDNQTKITTSVESNSKIFLDKLNIKLATEDPIILVAKGTIPIFNDINYKEETIEILGKEIGEIIYIPGYGDGYYEYATRILEKKAIDDDNIEITIENPFLREEVAHRVAGSYSPDPENPTKTSTFARWKADIEMKYGKYTDVANNIMQRAMVCWEDKFDKNLIKNLEKARYEEESLANLDEKAKDVVLKHIESFNINSDNVKIHIKIKNPL